MKPLEFNFELFEANCQSRGIANWIDGAESYLPEQNRLDRDRYAEGFFICMRRELDEAIPVLEEELLNLRTMEASLLQTGVIEGQIMLLKQIIGVQSSASKVNDK